MRATISAIVPVRFLATAACSHEPSPMGPSASITSSVHAPANGGAAVSGAVVSSNGTANLAVSVIGTTVSGRVDGSGQFSLTGVPSGSVDLRFAGSGTDARVAVGNVGDRDDVRITVRINGSSAEIEDRRHGTPDNRVEIEGTLTNVNAALRMLGVANIVVRVPTGSTIRRGGTLLDFSSLRVGDRVEIRASLDGSTVTATEVHVKSENGGPGNPGRPPNDDDDGEVQVKGIVQNRTGVCPSISFAIGSTTVVTNANTVFDDDPCSRIANGDRLEVHGTRQSNGSLLARRIEDDEDDDDDEGEDEDRNEVELEGTLSGRSGTYPAISFSVSGSSVVTNTSTEFKDGSCGSFTNGNRVRVRGSRQSSGTVLARRVEKRN